MARQSTTPVQFNRSMRKDTRLLLSSGRAGKVHLVGYAPLFAGDSASGSVGLDIVLKEMPRPLLNAVFANVQAWFVPKSAHPQFPGRDELLAAFTGTSIKQLGADERSPAPFFFELSGAAREKLVNSEMYRRLGIHVPAGKKVNTDLVDAFNIVYNFRLAAHSSRLKRKKYVIEDIDAAVKVPPAFWPSGRFAHVVPDYDKALVMGSLDLDVIKGRLPVSGLGIAGEQAAQIWSTLQTGSKTRRNILGWSDMQGSNHKGEGRHIMRAKDGVPDIWAEMTGQRVSVTLADIDKARTTQAFAKLRQAYAGNDTTGFNNDDGIIAALMQGVAMPSPDDFKRPWLLDSKRVPVGFAQRFATSGGHLEQSVTMGRASVQLSVNIPRQDVSGMIIYTVELLPERIHERMGDDFLIATSVDDLPNALRDIQRVEPVDLVPKWRVDARHSKPNELYGFEPMNKKWDRDIVSLGGEYYSTVPGNPFKESRSDIWMVDVVDPRLDANHFLAPQNFPHDVFSDTKADAFRVSCRHALTIVGNTQIGDVLLENNGEYKAVEAETL